VIEILREIKAYVSSLDSKVANDFK